MKKYDEKCCQPESTISLFKSLGGFSIGARFTQQPQTGLIGRFYRQVENRPKKEKEKKNKNLVRSRQRRK